MKTKPSFSVCVIVRNMANTLPRLGASLQEFLARGGEWILVDTGSTDGSADVARSLGAQVTEVGEQFMRTIDEGLAGAINERFVVDGEEPIVHPGSRLFHFSQARNYAASLATNDWVSWADGDEAFTRLDLDKIEEIIADPNLAHVEYDFVFAHQPDGVTPAVAFTQSKMYRRSQIYWSGVVHEVITPVPGAPPTSGPNHCFLDPAIFHLEHWQEPRDHRANYLPGLAWACYQDLDNDRNSHYLAREMFWTGRRKSAIREFKRHIRMNRWPAERAQSMIFCGDACGAIGDHEQQLSWYSQAYNSDPSRRAALLRLAGYWRGRDHVASAAYAAAALEVPFTPFYANDMAEYRELPHKLLYFAKGWTGDIDGARHHILRALDYSPFDPELARDLKFYFGYDPTEAPEGWMAPQELLWLWENAQGKARICEVGSWKGRSTHALCTGAAKTGGVVWAVDHFSGSVGEDIQHAEAKRDPDSVYNQFMANVGHFDHLRVRRADSLTAARDFPDGYFDMVFVDASHDYASVLADLQAWGRKAKHVLCGHDWGTWPEVSRAVREYLGGGPDGVRASIWHKAVQPPAVNPLLAYLTAMVREGKPVSFVKLGDGEEACMNGEIGANCDGHPYSTKLGWKLQMAFAELEKMAADRRDGRTRVNVVPFKDQAFYNILLHRNDSNFDAVKEFWGAVRERAANKIFVGPARLAGVARMLKAEHVEIPLVNAFESYDFIKVKLLNRATPDSVFIFCAGMPAKCWIAEILGARPSASCIDAGSAFDPLLVGQTRTEQLPQWLLEHEYKAWMEE